MICAYCGREAKATKEHIISSGILDLFPECFLTYDRNHNVIHQADPIVKDVCANCNNNLISYIDSYAKQIVQQYFLKKYEPDSTIEIEYNYTLLQKMLLKYAFNDLRARQDDISFFNRNVLNYLMNEDIDEPMDNVTVLAGLAVNTSPIPDFMFGNLKLQWCKSPVFMANSMVENIDYSTGEIRIREPFEIETFESLILSYIFRFNSGQFILMCWDKDSPKFTQNLNIIKLQYPYAMLSSNEINVTLERCTNELTYHRFQLIDVNWGNGIMDEISTMRKLASGSDKTMKKLNDNWPKEEARLAEKHRR